MNQEGRYINRYSNVVPVWYLFIPGESQLNMLGMIHNHKSYSKVCFPASILKSKSFGGDIILQFK